MAEIARADLRPLLGRTRAPLGLIWGELDRTVPVHGAGAIRGASGPTPSWR